MNDVTVSLALGWFLGLTMGVGLAEILWGLGG
jgi:hypothetical protein